MIPKTTWLIGSAPDCDLVVEEPSVSWHHCRLSQTAAGYLLEDLGSRNGTIVNGSRLQAPSPVTPLDTITLGLTTPMPWPGDGRKPEAGRKAEPPRSGPQGKTIVRVGRDPDNDFVIDDPEVSGLHARVIIFPGKFRGEIEDLGSTNGTGVNSPTNLVTHAPFSPGDMLFFGPVAVPASRFLVASPNEPGLVPEPVPADGIPLIRFQGTMLTIGRDPSCDLQFDAPVVSGRHARLLRSGSLIVLEDLRSSNGTFVNGRRIHEPTQVKHGDLIGLGAHVVRLMDGLAPASPLYLPDRGRPARAGSLGIAAYVLLAGLVIQPFLIALMIMLLGAPAVTAENTEGVRKLLVTALFGLAPGAVWLGLFGASLFHLVRGNTGARNFAEMAITLGCAMAGAVILCGLTLALVAARVTFPGDLFATFVLLCLTALAGFYLGEVLLGLTGRWIVAAPIGVALLALMMGLGSPRWPLPALAPVVRWSTAALPSRWAFEGCLLLNDKPTDAESHTEDLAELYFPAETERMGLPACFTSLVLMLVGLIGLNALISVSGRPPPRGASGGP